MEDGRIFSSFQDVNSFSVTSGIDENKVKIEVLSVKSELVDIKKEPGLSNNNESIAPLTDSCNTEQDNVDCKKFKYCHFEAKDNSEIWDNMQSHKHTLELKNEDLTFNKCYKPGLINQSVSTFDIKEENIDHDISLKFIENFLEENKLTEQKFIENADVSANFTSQEVIKCKYCNFETKYKDQLWGHSQIHRESLNMESQEVTLYKCPYSECKFQTIYKFSIPKHLHTHQIQKYKPDLVNQSTSRYDIKEENVDHGLIEQNVDINVEYNSLKFLEENTSTEQNTLEFKEPEKSLNGNLDISPENESDLIEPEIKMFGISQMFNFTSKEVIKCEYCNFETKHENQLWGHMSCHNGSLNSKCRKVTLYECPYPQCKFQTFYKYSITKHMNTHKIQKYKCSKCSFVTLQVKKYNQHIKSCEKVPEETLLQCDQCDFKVKTQGLLLVHKRKHKNESELLKCPECDLTTMYASALKKHIEKHRREENHLFTCTKCSYRSPSQSILMRHEKVHGKEEEESEGKYQCSDCSYQSVSLDELENHMVEHKGDRSEVGTVEGSSTMYSCPECPFKTSVISKVNHHKNLHIRQRNGQIYKCEHCNYETMYKYLLKRHSLKHKDRNSIKTYPCDLCDYRAKVKDYLVRHKRTHMKKQLQQYRCTVCLFETIYKHTFKEHLARHNISLVDVKKFLSDKPDAPEGGSLYVSEEVVELQNVLRHIAPTDSEANLDCEVT